MNASLDAPVQRPLTSSGAGASPAARLESLDALRGIAALAVCWFHLSHGGKLLPAGWAATVSSWGHLGVAAFFVISGFVIPWTVRRQSADARSYFRFLGKRILRLHPPFLIACLLAIALNQLSLLLPGYQGSLPQPYLPAALENLLWDSCYLTGILGKSWILVVAWTLAIEVQYYLLAGAVAPGLSSKRRGLVLVFLLACCAAPWLLSSHRWVLVFLPLFALGATAAWRRLGTGWLLVAPPVIAATSSIAVHHGPPSALVAFLTWGAIVFWNGSPPRILLGLGTLSYSLYLIHVPLGGRVVNLALRWAPEGFARVLLVVAATGGTLFASWLFWRWMEQPFHRWSRKRFDGAPRTA